MKITATVSKITEIELEVDDKFGELADDDFWEDNFKNAEKLAAELIKIIEYSDNNIDKIYGIYNTNGDVMAEP